MVKGKKKQQKKSDDSYDAWVEFSKKMSDRINKLAKDQVSEYKELYKLWSEYAQKMTDHMSAFSPDDSKAFEGMQQIWAQYSGKLGEMLMDSSGKDNGPYKELYDLWAQYSNSMNEHASELMTENLKNQQELYELWMDAFGIKDEGQKEHDNGPYDAINSFFKRMWEHSVSSIQPNASPDENFRRIREEWQDLWMKAYSKSVMDVVRSPAFADFNGHTLDTNLEMKQTSDRFANWYLSTMGVPTQQNIDEIHQKLHDLDRKMSDITRILNELSSTMKK